VAEQFTQEDLGRIEVIDTMEFSLGREAYEMEQLLLNDAQQYRYRGPPVWSSGNPGLLSADAITL